MPHVINGIGTWYYGRQNIHSYPGTCQACGKFTDLRTYDTTLFFVVVFVPLIPLGKKKIIDQCALCKRHRVAPLKRWESERSENIKTLVNAYCENPFDQKKAVEALRATIYFRATEAFRGLATLVDASFPDNPEIQSLLGGAQEFFGDQEPAIEAFQKSLAAKFDPGVAESLGLLFLRHKEPQQALATMRYVLEQKINGKINLLWAVAEGFQSLGMHGEAQALLTEIAGAFPGSENDPRFKRLQKTATKNAGTNRPIAAPKYVAGAGLRPTSLWRSRVPKFLLPIIAIIALTIYLGAAIHSGMSRTVYLVNGLSRPYTVQIDGQSQTLSPGTLASMTLPEGHHELAATGERIFIANQNFDIHTSFWARPFSSPAFVVNPDRTAILMEETAIYSSTPPPPTSKISTGQVCQTFSAIDYAFEEFPAEIHVESNSGSVVKRRVALYSGPIHAHMLNLITDELGAPAAANFVRDHLFQDPDDDAYLNEILRIAPAQAVSILRAQLSQRPVRIEWHRAYQGMVQRAEPEHDLAAEYSAFLAADTQNPDLLYLLGRVEPDRTKAHALFLRAANAQPPHAFAHYAMAYDDCAAARFADGAEHLRQALLIMPNAFDFQLRYIDALVAAGRLQDALAVIRAAQAANPLENDPGRYLTLASFEINLLSRLGRADEAESRMTILLDQAKSHENFKAYLSNFLHATRAYSQGNVAEFIRLQQPLPGGEPNLAAAIASANLEAASRSLVLSRADGTKDDASDHLLIYALAVRAGKPDLARDQLNLALALLREDGPEGKQAVKWFNGPAPSSEETLTYPATSGDKLALLLALAHYYPNHRKEYLDQARPFNYQTTFPYLTIKSILDAETK